MSLSPSQNDLVLWLFSSKIQKLKKCDSVSKFTADISVGNLWASAGQEQLQWMEKWNKAQPTDKLPNSWTPTTGIFKLWTCL